jgi:UDP-3-O-[3-hydroxymyristoyl] glucosamine N-acyltransferase
MAVDPRFYRAALPARLTGLTDISGLSNKGLPDISVSGISTFEDAIHGELCFVDDVKLADQIARICAQGAVCLTTGAIAGRVGQLEGLVVAEAPRLAFFEIASRFVTPIGLSAEADKTGGRIHSSAKIHPSAIISDGAVIGPDTVIGPYAVIEAGVQIGHDCDIGSSAQIGFALIGNGVVIGSGARLGGAGFGLLPATQGTKNTPHFGRVLVQDNVRIGANTCIDRGVLSDTIIGENAKIDNLCQIGHNTRIGRNVVMAAFAGISGSVEVGDTVMMGGRVGIVDHVSIGTGAQLAADAAVFSDVPAGETWAGSPARPLRQWQRETIWLRQKAQRKGGD